MVARNLVLLGSGVLAAGVLLAGNARAHADDQALAFITGAAVGYVVADRGDRVRPVHYRRDHHYYHGYPNHYDKKYWKRHKKHYKKHHPHHAYWQPGWQGAQFGQPHHYHGPQCRDDRYHGRGYHGDWRHDRRYDRRYDRRRWHD